MNNGHMKLSVLSYCWTGFRLPHPHSEFLSLKEMECLVDERQGVTDKVRIYARTRLEIHTSSIVVSLSTWTRTIAGLIQGTDRPGEKKPGFICTGPLCLTHSCILGCYCSTPQILGGAVG